MYYQKIFHEGNILKEYIKRSKTIKKKDYVCHISLEQCKQCITLIKALETITPVGYYNTVGNTVGKFVRPWYIRINKLHTINL